MVSQDADLNRRSEPRFDRQPARLAWRRNEFSRARRGWLRDVSASGLSFLTGGRHGLAIGDYLAVARRKRKSVVCCVRHVDTLPGGQFAVGCQRLDRCAAYAVSPTPPPWLYTQDTPRPHGLEPRIIRFHERRARTGRADQHPR